MSVWRHRGTGEVVRLTRAYARMPGGPDGEVTYDGTMSRTDFLRTFERDESESPTIFDADAEGRCSE